MTEDRDGDVDKRGDVGGPDRYSWERITFSRMVAVVGGAHIGAEGIMGRSRSQTNQCGYRS